MITKKANYVPTSSEKLLQIAFLFVQPLVSFQQKFKVLQFLIVSIKKMHHPSVTLKKITVYTVYFESNNSGIKVHHFCSSSRFNDDSTFLL